jgi:RecB family exonuclease
VPTLAIVPFEVVTTPYGRPAAEALRRAVAAAKGGDPLATVTVVVAANHVGVAARRLLASGALGPVCPTGTGVAGVTFLTAYRLAELLGAARLAAAGRRPISTPVLGAAMRQALGEIPGMFAPVAAHPATETALVGAFGELADVSAAGLESLAGASRRAADVVALCRRARTLFAPDWYDEADLADAAIAGLLDDGQRGGPGPNGRIGPDLGYVVVHLPQDLLQRQARLLRTVSEQCPSTVIAGLTGVDAADAGVVRALERLGCRPTVASAAGTPAESPLPARAAGPGTRLLTASDADDEVRAAVRAVVDAARGGTPLERIAILFGDPQPYARLVHEHLAAAGVPRNGAAVRPLAASVAGRTLLDLLALPDHNFRRADVLGVLARGSGRRGRPVPTTQWERLSREAGVVAGRDHWDQLLERLAGESDRRAESLDAEGPDPFDEAGTARRRESVERARRRAQRTRDLRSLVLGLIDASADAAAQPQPWRARVSWLRRLSTQVLGDGERDSWPADQLRAAEMVDAALDRLLLLDGIGAPPSLDVFRRTLELELDADLGRVGRFGEGVLVGPLSFAVGLDLDLVVVVGMAEGSLPATVQGDSLLPDDERRRLDGELPLRRDRVGRDHRQLIAALSAANRQLLCAPRGDLRASSERVASRWLVAAASEQSGQRVSSDALAGLSAGWIAHTPSFAHAVAHAMPATEQEYRLRAGESVHRDPLTAAGSRTVRARRSTRFTRFDGNLAGVAVPSPLDEVVSSTRLEAWATCPFAYFVGHVLRVEPVEIPERELTMTALSKGSLVHEILERFLREVLARPGDQQPGPDQPWTDHDHARIRSIAGQACDEYEARGLTGRPVFWRGDRRQIIELASHFLHEDDQQRRANRSRPAAAELRFGFGDLDAVSMPLADGRTLRFRGAADRIDVADDGTLFVVDYKTGRPNSYRSLNADNPDERGTRLQLAVYGLAARTFLRQPAAPVQAHYWFVWGGGAFERIGYAVDDEVLARVGSTLSTMVDGIERGAFPPRPDPTTRPWVTCPYCDPDALGVADLRRDWDRKRDDPAIAAYAELAEPREPVAAVATNGSGR